MEILEFAMPLWGSNKELPDPDLVMFYKGLESRDFWLDTEINLDTCSLLIKYIQYLNTHIDEKNNMTPITLHIASPGGELWVMFLLYHTIKNSAIPVHTINEGSAHSAAFIVFLAGDIRSMNPDATFIAHEGSGMLGGSYRENKRAMAQYEKDVLRMKNIIVDRSDLTIEEINKHFDEDQDWYINYDCAKEVGILTITE